MLGSRPATPQARPPALSSAAPATSCSAHSLGRPSDSMPAGSGLARQALLELASEARRHPFRDGQPPPAPPPRVGQPPPPPPPQPRIPPGLSGVKSPAAVHTSAQPGIRPYLQPYQMPPGGIRPGAIHGPQFRQPNQQQAPQEPYRQPNPPQAPQEPYHQSFTGGLEPYRPVAAGRGVGPSAGRAPVGRPAYTGPGQGPTSGDVQQCHCQCCCEAH